MAPHRFNSSAPVNCRETRSPRRASSLPIVLALTLLFCSLPTRLFAQGVDCTVHVNYEAVIGTYKDLLVDLGSEIRDYVNGYQWGADNVPDKITCTIDVFVQGVSGDNQYTAQIFVGSQRQLYKSNKATAVLRLKDDSWVFTYVKGRAITHTPQSFNDFTSVLDFYMYLIVGYDADTYDPLGGSAFFQKAADIARLAQSSGQTGWLPSYSSITRASLINDILFPTCDQLRQASYLYHFAGLDSLAIDAKAGQKNILQALIQIGKLRSTLNTRNLAVKTFFDTKYMEIADVFLTYPDKSVYKTIMAVDPTHQMTYEEYQAKRKD